MKIAQKMCYLVSFIQSKVHCHQHFFPLKYNKINRLPNNLRHSVQKKAIRIVTNSLYNCELPLSYTSLVLCLKIVSLTDEPHFGSVVFASLVQKDLRLHASSLSNWLTHNEDYLLLYEVTLWGDAAVFPKEEFTLREQK